MGGVKVEEFMNSCEASVRGCVNPGETRCSSDGGEERRKMHSQGFFICDVFTADFTFVDGKKNPKAPTSFMLERLQLIGLIR